MRLRRLSASVLRVGLVICAAIAFEGWRHRALLSWPPAPPRIARPYPAYLPGENPKQSPAAVLPGIEAPLPSPLTGGPTLRAALDTIRDRSNLRIDINWPAIEGQGFSQQTSVSLELGDRKAGDAISDVLMAVDPKRLLGFFVERDGVTITTIDDASKLVATRVYDVRDLITVDGRRTAVKRDNAVDDLIADVQAAVAPESWKPRGVIGQIQELGGQLIVTQTPENHVWIANELAQARWRRSMIEIAKPSLGIIAGVAALTVFIELILWRRRMLLSARVGLCPTCDYDLRGSTDRCPECGTAIKVATK